MIDTLSELLDEIKLYYKKWPCCNAKQSCATDFHDQIFEPFIRMKTVWTSFLTWQI